MAGARKRGPSRWMRVLGRLHEATGPPEPPPAREPFAVVVWENCSYLVDDVRRAAVYRVLERRIGIDPAAIAAAPAEALRAILLPGGMKAAYRFGTRLCEFSIQGNHVHLVVEAEHQAAPSRVMKGVGCASRAA